jgi:DNA-directed RNA polymerase subunit RPC12/RpoP
MTDILTLTCPSCGGKARLIEGTNRLHCDYCGNEHVVEMRFQPAPEDSAARLTPIRTTAFRPSSMRVERDAESARIIQRWFSPKYVPMAFFCVAWDAFLIFWYSMVLGGGAPWIFAVFPIVHLAVGIGITYSTLAGFLNRTVVELTREDLSVWYQPLPWLGEKTIPTAEIQQLFCKETRKDGKSGPTY